MRSRAISSSGGMRSLTQAFTLVQLSRKWLPSQVPLTTASPKTTANVAIKTFLNMMLNPFFLV